MAKADRSDAPAADAPDLAAQLEAQKAQTADLAAKLEALTALVGSAGRKSVSAAEVSRIIDPTVRDPSVPVPTHPGLGTPYFDDLRPTGRR